MSYKKINTFSMERWISKIYKYQTPNNILLINFQLIFILQLKRFSKLLIK